MSRRWDPEMAILVTVGPSNVTCLVRASRPLQIRTHLWRELGDAMQSSKLLLALASTVIPCSGSHGTNEWASPPLDTHAHNRHTVYSRITSAPFLRFQGVKKSDAD
jgi:hypothetical protein